MVVGPMAIVSEVSCVLFANIVRFSSEMILVHFLPTKMLYFSINLLGISHQLMRDLLTHPRYRVRLPSPSPVLLLDTLSLETSFPWVESGQVGGQKRVLGLLELEL